MSCTHIADWFHHFKGRWTSVESDACSGCPSSSKSDGVIVVVRVDQTLTIRVVAVEPGISFGL